MKKDSLTIGIFLAWAAHASSVWSQDGALADYEFRLEELAGVIDASAEGGGNDGARRSAIAGLRQLDGTLAAEENTSEVRALRSKIWYQIGTSECEHGDASEGQAALWRSLEFDANPERTTRIQRRLHECGPLVVPPPTVLNVPLVPVHSAVTLQPAKAEPLSPVEPPPTYWSVPVVPVQSAPVSQPAKASPAKRPATESRGRALVVGGAVLGLVGGSAVLGTWCLYQANPSMSSQEWMGLQTANTLGWVALGGGGVMIVSGAARGGFVEFTPTVFPVK